jgi:putative transposase
MARTAPRILVTERQRRILDKLERSHKTSQQLVPRVQIVKLSGQGVPNNEQATELDMGPEAIGRWRHRWLDGQAELAAAEESGVSDLELERLILKVLADGPRTGAPPRFGAHQVAQIFALACEPPEKSGVPFSHWTPAALARELAKRGIVDSISARQVGRFLKGGRHSAAQGQVLAAKHARGSRALRRGGPDHLRALRAGDDAPRTGRPSHQL